VARAFVYDSYCLLRCEAIDLPTDAGNKEAARWVRGLLDDPFSEVRSSAIDALATLKDNRAAEFAERLLDDFNNFVRRDAALALARNVLDFMDLAPFERAAVPLAE